MDSVHFSGALAASPCCQRLSSGLYLLSGQHNAVSPSVYSQRFHRLLKLQLRKHVCTTALLIPLSSKLSAKSGSSLCRNCSLRPKPTHTESTASHAATFTIRKLSGKSRVAKRICQVQCQGEHGAKNAIIYSNGAVYERLEIEDVHTPRATVPLVEEERRESVYLPSFSVNPLSIKGIDELCEDGECSIHENVAPNDCYFGDNHAQEYREDALDREAWKLLRSAVISYCGNPVGTMAANDPTDPNPLNYDQVFIRDFVPSALAFLLKGETDIVRNFLLHTLQLQSWEKTVDCHSPGQGLMPASFKVRSVPVVGDNFGATEETLEPDFGEAAIGRVAPVDSGLWWIILLRAYGKYTGDFSLQERVDVQTGMKMILKLCLSDGFDMFPTLLVTDGSCMIDRRMGIHGHPLEIQALFYSSLRCAREMLTPEDGAQDLIRAVNSRLSALSFHIREYYWVDMRKLNEIYRYKTEEYSFDAVNKFNIYPEQIPQWLVDWIPDQGGYLIGNLQPAHMDFRFFSLGNLWSIVGSLATNEQAEGILDLVEARWSNLVGNMPFKICFPALEGEEWRIITGSDPKNTPWSYHNGGSWPALIWQFTAACIKMGRLELAKKALNVAEKRLSRDRWPEYYDTHTGRFIGKQARLYQTWTIAGYLVAKMMLSKPETARILTCEEDLSLLEAMSCSLDQNPRRKHSRKASSYLFV